MSLLLDLRGKLPPRHAPSHLTTPVEARTPPRKNDLIPVQYMGLVRAFTTTLAAILWRPKALSKRPCWMHPGEARSRPSWRPCRRPGGAANGHAARHEAGSLAASVVHAQTQRLYWGDSSRQIVAPT